MHVLVFSLMFGVVVAAPQGYNYQSGENNNNEGLSFHQQQTSQNAPSQANQQYNKEFYHISAPADQLPDNYPEQLQYRKKNLRVIFIKSPESNGLSNALLQLSKETQSSKTAIYVLTRQHSAADLSSKLQNQPARISEKPEVVFIKYRKPAEAEHAQRTIQKQYEKLKGPSYIGFETVAPTLNFVSSAHASGAIEVSTAASASYLPPTQ